MGYWSVAILVISVSFLAYRHPEATRNALPPWLRSRKSSILSAGKDETEPVDDEKESEVEGDAPSFKVSEPEETEQGDETPKSNAIQPKDAVPSFSLSDDKNNENDIKPIPKLASDQTTEPTNPSPPTLSPQTTMPPPPALAPPKPSSSSLMPPPAPKPSTLMPPPSRPTPLPNRNPTSTLRTPQANLLPNRGPPTNSQQRAGSSNNGKGKILLSPGHSPMDWAALSRDPKANLAGVPSLQRVTPSQLKTMTGRKGKPAWSSYHGKVYNLTPYLPFHPGGEPELMRAAGRDGGKLFMEVHPWVNWEGMLSSCVVGILVGESEGVSEMEEMD